jgi:hypothetical protein
LGFTDALDRPANVLSGVKITTLPSAGSLKLSGVEVAAGQTVPAASVPNLQFIPAANANGSPYTGFTFQVKDTGGTANGGIDLDPTPNTITFNVTPVNDAPSGADKTIGLLKNTSYTIAVADFGFSDPNDSPANQFARVRIAGLPAAGSLKLSGAPVSLWQFIKVSDISAGKLMFTPAANATGSPYAKVLFQVEDDGGTANGGLNLDATSNALTFNVTAAPAPAASLLAACALPEQSPRANKGLDRYHDLALATAVWN